jgi:hypothetical protein
MEAVSDGEHSDFYTRSVPAFGTARKEFITTLNSPDQASVRHEYEAILVLVAEDAAYWLFRVRACGGIEGHFPE